MVPEAPPAADARQHRHAVRDGEDEAKHRCRRAPGSHVSPERHLDFGGEHIAPVVPDPMYCHCCPRRQPRSPLATRATVACVSSNSSPTRAPSRAPATATAPVADRGGARRRPGPGGPRRVPAGRSIRRGRTCDVKRTPRRSRDRPQPRSTVKGRRAGSNEKARLHWAFPLKVGRCAFVSHVSPCSPGPAATRPRPHHLQRLLWRVHDATSWMPRRCRRVLPDAVIVGTAKAVRPGDI
jgi:hypothetical protein